MRDEMDFRFSGPGRYGDRWYNQFYLDENQLYHREDGPAIVDAEGNKGWYWRDKLHREDGPAVEMKSGEVQFWIHGVQLTPEEFEARQQEKKKALARTEGEKLKAEMENGLQQTVRPLHPPVFKR